jgi:CRISPR/Cas system-associated exonuclease Cas4 (RecB family)
MDVDTSEIKDFRNCIRKWAFTSRNMMHLRPITTPKAFAFGIAFHAGLHTMYSGKAINYESDELFKEVIPEELPMLIMLLKGYEEQVLPNDLEKFEVLHLEYRFDEPVRGSIDMVVRDNTTGAIYGVEHKTGKTFRGDMYNQLDEQLMMYTLAIEKAFGRCDGIYLNEIKKLKTKFESKRTLCRFTREELDYFMEGISETIEQMELAVSRKTFRACPNAMSCAMCDYQPLCMHIKSHGDISAVTEDILATYDLATRSTDHLNEKPVDLSL